MKFKAGDLVQIKSLDEVKQKGAGYFKFTFVGAMRVYCGKVYRIKSIDELEHVHFENSSPEMEGWLWSESMLDPYYQPSEPAECEIMNLF